MYVMKSPTKAGRPRDAHGRFMSAAAVAHDAKKKDGGEDGALGEEEREKQVAQEVSGAMGRGDDMESFLDSLRAGWSTLYVEKLISAGYDGVDLLSTAEIAHVMEAGVPRAHATFMVKRAVARETYTAPKPLSYTAPLLRCCGQHRNGHSTWKN